MLKISNGDWEVAELAPVESGDFEVVWSLVLTWLVDEGTTKPYESVSFGRAFEVGHCVSAITLFPVWHPRMGEELKRELTEQLLRMARSVA